MKKSKYNIINELENGVRLAFNSSSCALAEVEDDFINILDEIETIDVNTLSPEKKELVEDMKKGNFIIEDCVDEIEQLKFINKRGKYSNNSFGLTIAPTLFCNFKCPYCYETPQNEQMSEEVQNGIIELVKENAKYLGDLSVTWYGGEPLIGKDVVFALSAKLIDLCKENGIEYSAFMVTNGYLVTEQVVEKMKEAQIMSCQITVDGPERIHNTRRILKDGTGSFNQIIKNIKLLKKNDINVNIRVNIDKTNLEYVEELLTFLEENGLQDLHINFGQVTAYTEACSSIAGNCLSTKEYSSANINLQKLLHKHGFNADDYPYYPGIKSNYCCADQINSFVVDPKGFIYKCWNNIGSEEDAVGNVLRLKDPKVEETMRSIKWVEVNPFEGECLSCKLLPICMGGCPYMKLKDGKSANCEKWKYHFNEMIKYTYEYKSLKEKECV